jgi:hypothetical protein
MPGSLPAQSQKMNSSQPELNNGTKVSYKRGRSTQEETEGEAKHTKDSEHWLNQTSSCYTTLLEEESEDQKQKAGPENTPKPPIYITDVKNISPLIQLLEQIAKQQYKIKALADNQVKIQPKTSEFYRVIYKSKALAEKRTEFHTWKLKEERSYRVVLKNMHYCINPEEIKTEIEKLGHRVTNIWNIKQYRTKLPLHVFCRTEA